MGIIRQSRFRQELNSFALGVKDRTSKQRVCRARVCHERNVRCDFLDTYSTFKEILESLIFLYSKIKIFSGRIFKITSQNGHFCQNLGFRKKSQGGGLVKFQKCSNFGNFEKITRGGLVKFQKISNFGNFKKITRGVCKSIQISNFF